MSQVNYDAMSDAELKQYFLKHREDKTALQAYNPKAVLNYLLRVASA